MRHMFGLGMIEASDKHAGLSAPKPTPDSICSSEKKHKHLITAFLLSSPFLSEGAIQNLFKCEVLAVVGIMQ